METARCICKNCESEIGQCINIWTRIGDHHFTLVIDHNECLEIEAVGEVRLGGDGSLMEGCRIQSITCARCTKAIGTKCVATPVNHVLGENQMVLNSKYVALFDDDGNEVEFVVKRVLDVKKPSGVHSSGKSTDGPTSSNHEVVDVFQLQSDLQMQKEDLKRIDSGGFKLARALERRMASIEGEVKNLQITLGEVRRDMVGAEDDIRSVKTEVGEVKWLVQSHPPAVGLEHRLGLMTSTLGEVRQEVAGLVNQYTNRLAELDLELSQSRKDIESLRSDINGREASRRYANDMSAVLAELSQLRQEMNGMRTTGRGQIGAPFSSRELEIITTNIAKIGSRANQVEPLQMEFEILKGRVERMEADRHALISEPGQPAVSVQVPGDSHPHMKRNSSAIENPAVQNPASGKRPMLSSAYPHKPFQGRDTSPQQDAISAMLAPKLRLTKDGNVDKRSLRYRRPLDGTK